MAVGEGSEARSGDTCPSLRRPETCRSPRRSLRFSRRLAARSDPTGGGTGLIGMWKALADFLILRQSPASHGDAGSVTDDEMRRAADEIGAAEGLFVAPEGAAVWAAAKDLAAAGRLESRSRIVLFNTGTGFKYLS